MYEKNSAFVITDALTYMAQAQTVFDNTTVNSAYVLSDTVLPTVANVDTEGLSTTVYYGSGLQVKTFKKVSAT